jgi:hypothetical protein
VCPDVATNWTTGSGSVALKWSIAASSRVYQFSVSFFPWYLESTSAVILQRAVTNATLMDLSPGVPYFVSVSAIASPASNNVDAVCTERPIELFTVVARPSVPVAAVSIVSVQALNATTFLVVFQTIEPALWGDSTIRYVLTASRLANQSNADPLKPSESQISTMLNPNDTKTSVVWNVSMSVSQANVEYVIRARTENSVGIGPTGASIVARSAESGLVLFIVVSTHFQHRQWHPCLQ